MRLTWHPPNLPFSRGKRFLCPGGACLAILAAGACRPLPPPPRSEPAPSAHTHAISSPPPLPLPPAPPSAVAAASPRQSLEITSGTWKTLTADGVAFDSRNHSLRVVDQPGGPGSQFATAADAGRAHGALAAVNAGFFTPEGQPMGLVQVAGNRSGNWNSATSLGSGIWFTDDRGTPAIVRREAIGREKARNQPWLLQAGPLLIEHGRPVSGLDPQKSSARTLLAWDGGTRWWLGRTSPCTLAALADWLANSPPVRWPVQTALNLDGGLSSDLWISNQIPGGPLTRRPLWNRAVRNFLILLPARNP